MKKKNKLSAFQVKKIFKFRGTNNNLISFYYTGIVGIFVILFFFITPKLVIFKNNFLSKSIEVKNDSKSNLEKVLSNKNINEEQEGELDNLEVFQDIFEYEDIPVSTVRLNASTIKQLFKDTNYNLKNVRKNKLDKPVNLEILPQ